MKKLIYILFILQAMFSYHQAEARVLEINLEKMTRLAGKIVAGECIDVQKGFHPQYPNVKVTFVELDIFDVIKGDVDARLKFMQFGHGIEMPHASKYQKGEKVLLFLYPESQYGFTSPVGDDQGKLSIKTDPVSGKPTFVYISNYGELFKDIDTRALEDTNGRVNLIDIEPGLLSYERFRQIIQSIIIKQEKDK